MYFIVNNLDNLQTDTVVYSVNTLNVDCLHRPFVNLWYFQKDAYFVLIKINSPCHSLRSITNKKGKFEGYIYSQTYTVDEFLLFKNESLSSKKFCNCAV
jgi:hypothetical protein